MKKKKTNYPLKTFWLFLIAFFLGLCEQMCGQTYSDTIGYDCMEMYNWSGNWWVNNSNIGFASNIAVSAPASAYFYGTGGGNSPAEYNWYVLPNIDTLNPDEEHKMKFHFASPRITSTGAASGIDLADYIDIQVSTDGGITYNSEVRVTGFNNAYWGYNSATVSKVVNGTLDTYTPAGGGDRTLLGDGISIVELTFPLGTTQIAIDVYVRANAAGEEFWMDDFFMLGSGGGGFALPITLTSFIGYPAQDGVVVEWTVLSEVNNNYFTIDRSFDCYNWEELATVPGNGNHNNRITYNTVDENPTIGINYYRLKQTDYNGDYEYFNPIAVIMKPKRRYLEKVINLTGQEVDENYKGVVIDIYSDGVNEKRIQE